MQATLAHEHVSTQDTLARKDARYIGTGASKAGNLTLVKQLFGLSDFAIIRNNIKLQTNEKYTFYHASKK